MEPWLDDLRAAFDREFGRDWRAHVASLNAKLGLTGSDTLVEVDRPPEFFWGDLEAFVPGEWVAVLSLNPQLTAAKWDDWYGAQAWTPQSYWDYLTRRDLRSDLDGRPFTGADYYYARFVRPLVKLAGAALGIADPMRDEVNLAMRRMAFFDILPYASRTYVPRPEVAASMAESDPACAIARKATLGAIEHRRPAAVLVNGSDAVHVFEAVHKVAWVERRYESRSNPSKTLRHAEATIGRHEVPVFGFPQLRGMSSHNSNVEIAQLAERIAEVVRR